jgi:hypothetical protein
MVALAAIAPLIPLVRQTIRVMHPRVDEETTRSTTRDARELLRALDRLERAFDRYRHGIERLARTTDERRQLRMF